MGEEITSKFSQEIKNTSEDILVTNVRQKTLSAALLNTFNFEDVKKELRWWKRSTMPSNKRSDLLGKMNNFNRVTGLCLLTPSDPKLVNQFRKTGLNRLAHILTNFEREEVQANDIRLLTWSCLNLISFYSSKQQEYTCHGLKKSKISQSKGLFRIAMYHVFPEKQYELIKYTIQFITLTSQWNSEEFSSFVFPELIMTITMPEILMAKIVKQIEISQREKAIKEAFDVSYTLCSILEHIYWKKYLYNLLLHDCFNTLLKIYLLSNNPMSSVLQIENARFRIAIKTCIKYFISNIKDNKGLVSVMDAIAKCLQDPSISEEDQMELTEMIAISANKHHTKYYQQSITPDLLKLLLNHLLLGEKLALISLKILNRLLDRNGNEINFKDPIFYFKGRSNIIINYEYDMEDIHFIKSFGGKFLEGIYYCMISFNDKYAFVSCYTALCLVLVETPEPVITINIIHTLIKIQNYILENEDLSSSVKFQIHGIISSIFSLICLIHDEEVVLLKKYLDQVVRFRTENSPHLLPPLQNKYTVADHHTTEYHDQLYFLEHEVLYALQRCWLSRRVKTVK